MDENLFVERKQSAKEAKAIRHGQARPSCCFKVNSMEGGLFVSEVGANHRQPEVFAG